MNDFLPKEPQEVVDALKKVLYDRLSDVRRASAVEFDQDDEFNQGINCRLANEEMWLENVLDKIERS
jgi:hypothetical protein